MSGTPVQSADSKSLGLRGQLCPGLCDPSGVQTPGARGAGRRFTQQAAELPFSGQLGADHETIPIYFFAS